MVRTSREDEKGQMGSRDILELTSVELTDRSDVKHIFIHSYIFLQ